MKKWLLPAIFVVVYISISGAVQKRSMKKWILDREHARGSYGPTEGPVRVQSIS